jgi:hypothetical protein
MGGKLSSGSCRGCGAIFLVSHLLFSAPLHMHGTKLEIGKLRRVLKRDYAFYIFVIWETKVGLQKSNFSQPLLQSRSLLLLLWAKSQFPPADDDPVLNKCRKNLKS